MVTAMGRITWLVKERVKNYSDFNHAWSVPAMVLSVGPRPVASASPGNLLEMQNLGPHPIH